MLSFWFTVLKNAWSTHEKSCIATRAESDSCKAYLCVKEHQMDEIVFRVCTASFTSESVFCRGLIPQDEVVDEDAFLAAVEDPNRKSWTDGVESSIYTQPLEEVDFSKPPVGISSWFV